MELEKILALEELKAFKHIAEIYEYLKKKSSLIVKEILDNNEHLKQELVRIATNYRKTSQLNGVIMVKPEDELVEKLIELNHTFFDIKGGCGNIYLMLNLNNYLNGDKKDIIYSVFVYSEDDEDATYAEELSEEKHHDLMIPDNVFFRQLPAMYLLSSNDSALEVLIAVSQRTCSICIDYDHVDIRTGKVFDTAEL
jgi:hypothetical protein